jgi:hypothetical protein
MTRDEELDLLLTKQKIIELSYTYSRACDRLDKELLKTVYWPDGTDDHGIFKGTAVEYVDWVMDFLDGWTSTQHSNTNFLLEVDGDDAWGECEWVGFYRIPTDDGGIDQLSAGRYLDHYQRREGEWRIFHRTCTTEWSRGTPVETDWRADPGPSIIGKRDRTDPVYRLREIAIVS